MGRGLGLTAVMAGLAVNAAAVAQPPPAPPPAPLAAPPAAAPAAVPCAAQAAARTPTSCQEAAQAVLRTRIEGLREEAKASAAKIIVAGGVGDLFSVEHIAATPTARHKETGMRCRFFGSPIDAIAAPPASDPARRDHAVCATATYGAGAALSLVRAKDGVGLEAAFAAVEAEQQAAYPSLRPRATPAAQPGALPLPGDLPTRVAWYSLTGKDGAPMVLRLSLALTEGWVIRHDAIASVRGITGAERAGNEGFNLMLAETRSPELLTAMADLMLGLKAVVAITAPAPSAASAAGMAPSQTTAAVRAAGTAARLSARPAPGADTRLLLTLSERLLERTRLDTEGLIDAADAWDVFEPVSPALEPTVRHRQSGLLCAFDRARRDARLMVTTGPGYGRGEAVGCQSVKLGQVTLVRAAPGLTLEQAFARLEADVARRWPGAAPRAAQRTSPERPPRGAPMKTVRYEAGGRGPGGRSYIRASAAIIDGYVVGHVIGLPSDQAPLAEAAADRAFAQMIDGRRSAPRVEPIALMLRTLEVLGGVAGSFEQADVDGDGRVGREEWRWSGGMALEKADADAGFDKGDRNRDGTLDGREYAAAAPKKPVSVAPRAAMVTPVSAWPAGCTGASMPAPSPLSPYPRIPPPRGCP